MDSLVDLRGDVHIWGSDEDMKTGARIVGCCTRDKIVGDINTWQKGRLEYQTISSLKYY